MTTAPRAPLPRALGILFGLHLVARLAEMVFADRAALAAGVGGLVALWGAERAGVQPMPEEATSSTAAWAREIALGVAASLLGFALLVAGAAALGGSVSLGGMGGSLVLSLIRAGFRGLRDELILTGAASLLAAALARPGRTPALLLPLGAALTHAADAAGAEGATLGGIALGAAAGALAGALWASGSGARAIAFAAGWSFASGLGVRGALVDVEGLSFVLQPAHRTSGSLGWVACAALVALALAAPRLPAARRVTS